ncbi:hypothetical protein [Kitasatospora sp. NPDC101183]|uniref:hypothetical protein n=1 Tax=Kitasatospora sp. NPDC101183 TaxID=3364100 RepID=UPI0037F9A8FA
MEQKHSERWYATALRVGLELVAWICLPIALWHHSIPLAIGVDVLLIGAPALFQTPGDKPGTVIPVPGWVTILMVLVELAAADIAAQLLFPTWAATVVTLLVIACCTTELPRWNRLLGR